MELYSAWSFVVIHGAVKCVVVNSHNLMIVPNPTTQREGKGGKGGVGVSGRERRREGSRGRGKLAGA